ncbi:hypothetical protein TNCT_535621 [Trichonephila clavata]|uniref:Uncharacterized protein n=1 Tax=Trichonephila clavata TaxID=2740835 RepID=A0A8X6GP94_TRICU|nr:hypothetical protein TNCT_535621 [Trichonephila clavata]
MGRGGGEIGPKPGQPVRAAQAGEREEGEAQKTKDGGLCQQSTGGAVSNCSPFTLCQNAVRSSFVLFKSVKAFEHGESSVTLECSS